MYSTKPKHKTYDVIIIGGAIMGSSVAWHLVQNNDFNGRVLVIEADPSYQFASSTHTNSCLRQQFSQEINVKISQYAFEYISNFHKNFKKYNAPKIPFHGFGYLYLSNHTTYSDILCRNQAMQSQMGVGTQIMTHDQLSEKFPFMNLTDIELGSYNPDTEGYFDGSGLFQWWRTQSIKQGVEYIHNTVVGIEHDSQRVGAVQLQTGDKISADYIINCAGPQAANITSMVGVEIPVEPRKRFTFVFKSSDRLGQDLPLTVDPSGIHVRTDVQYYMVGCAPKVDNAVAYDDFEMDHDIWIDKVWPALAYRIPKFERIKPISEWVGHYAYNLLDQNAIIGPHTELHNFMFANGFSGHGLQQSPAVGRGLAELIIYGEYQTLDLSELGYDRIISNTPLSEGAII